VVNGETAVVVAVAAREEAGDADDVVVVVVNEGGGVVVVVVDVSLRPDDEDGFTTNSLRVDRFPGKARGVLVVGGSKSGNSVRKDGRQAQCEKAWL